MKKVLGIVTLCLFLIVGAIVFALLINHALKVKEEAKEYPPPGKIVEVNNKKLHVFTAGEGNTTLVFLSGHGTGNPTMDFKPLWMRMTDEYRIAVVERPGYGWSDTTKSPRNIDTILEETRQALKLSGETAPYVLFPHSMSGLEAIYWAQKYPDEVKAIIGLDPCTPGAIEEISVAQKIQLYVMHFISRLGLSRWMPESDLGENLPLMKSDELSNDDKAVYLAVFYKSAFTKDMIREAKSLKSNAEIVAENPIPIDTPMYFFISDGQEADSPGWTKSLTDFLSDIAYAKHMQLATGHYIHYDMAQIITEKAKAFIQDLQ